MEYRDIFLKGEAITLSQMLDARELRVFRQKELLERYHRPLLCFTMNIAGPVKNNPWILRGFQIGVSELRQQLIRLGIKLLFEAVYEKK